jgi:hypothetical protein
MSSIESAPATIPASNAVTLTGAFGDGTVSRSTSNSDRPARSAKASTGASPRARHEIRLVEHCIDHRRVMGQLHLADALLEHDVEPSTSPIVPAVKKGIRLSRHADHHMIDGGSGAEPPRIVRTHLTCERLKTDGLQLRNSVGRLYRRVAASRSAAANH